MIFCDQKGEGETEKDMQTKEGERSAQEILKNWRDTLSEFERALFDAAGAPELDGEDRFSCPLVRRLPGNIFIKAKNKARIWYDRDCRSWFVRPPLPPPEYFEAVKKAKAKKDEKITQARNDAEEQLQLETSFLQALKKQGLERTFIYPPFPIREDAPGAKRIAHFNSGGVGHTYYQVDNFVVASGSVMTFYAKPEDIKRWALVAWDLLVADYGLAKAAAMACSARKREFAYYSDDLFKVIIDHFSFKKILSLARGSTVKKERKDA